MAAAPLMALPVLFKEIADELGLNPLQIGFIWGAGSATGMFISVFGGSIGDRFGSKRTLVVACLLAGITGVLPGLATDFLTLLSTVFLFGLVRPVIPINLHKTCAVWFPSSELGLANGFVSTGMALGFLFGSLFSATLLSPALGGWRHVIFFYAGLATVISLLWLLTPPPPTTGPGTSRGSRPIPLREGLPYVVRLRPVWVLGVVILGYGACVQGFLGYLPLYLRGIGWPATSADGALATFHGVSLCAALPIAWLSDRLRTRRALLMLATGMLAAGVGLLPFVDESLIWGTVILAGLMRDGFMAIFMTTVMEVRGIGAAYAGTAIGFTMMLGGIGRVVSPPLGNSLVGLGEQFPFLFWAMMALLALVSLGFFPPTPFKERD
ncbi:MAG: MFS transporter [Nitrospinota bacterium]|nr:MAG: MFS transporter [Nitrospinota bacterium]